MVAMRQRHYWTPEEYLAFERASDTRHEYMDGEILDLAGASRNHGIVSGNTFASLHQQLRQRDCLIFQGDMRVKTSDESLYTYPGVVVVCGERHFDDAAYIDTLVNPTVIIEVLSPSTEQYDRDRKFRRYRSIESLQEYVLIAQDKPLIEMYIRQPEGKWLIAEAQGLDAEIALDSIQCRLALADIYEKVTFEAPTPP